MNSDDNLKTSFVNSDNNPQSIEKNASDIGMSNNQDESNTVTF